MRLARSADEKNARQSKQRKSGMARDKEEGSRVPACLLRCGTKRQKMDKEDAGYGNVYNLLGLHRKTDRDCIPPLRSFEYKAERKRKRKKDKE